MREGARVFYLQLGRIKLGMGRNLPEQSRARKHRNEKSPREWLHRHFQHSFKNYLLVTDLFNSVALTEMEGAHDFLTDGDLTGRAPPLGSQALWLFFFSFSK